MLEGKLSKDWMGVPKGSFVSLDEWRDGWVLNIPNAPHPSNGAPGQTIQLQSGDEKELFEIIIPEKTVVINKHIKEVPKITLTNRNCKYCIKYIVPRLDCPCCLGTGLVVDETWNFVQGSAEPPKKE